MNYKYLKRISLFSIAAIPLVCGAILTSSVNADDTNTSDTANTNAFISFTGKNSPVNPVNPDNPSQPVNPNNPTGHTGDLAFDYIPANLNFGNHDKNANTQTYSLVDPFASGYKASDDAQDPVGTSMGQSTVLKGAQKDYVFVQLHDMMNPDSGWNVNASFDGYTNSGKTLNGATINLKDGNAQKLSADGQSWSPMTGVSNNIQLGSDNAPQNVLSADKSKSAGITQIYWDPSNISTTIPGGSSSVAGKDQEGFRGKITWNVNATPNSGE
ncbi:hypothetical protein BGL34_06680 [Fructilactobacillus lindneri]|uniref:WxL domain-containing protein n=1 Tax=Fructilactobacillus lindneri DSM 20690 = JCM 11027 TaxID=1122148 RepID=A0A0R2JRG6_9LACO|nr:WxL domain-containing protein [Fructilactobacillus lindneri]KRN79681.1 hypothetical protein IV52_GL000218 [Fructilactobacillus lindneri DSM 20690 = JCM 11027]POH04645.1 hypothetical protein BGL34_06680 [Fructilactobacillus lindneri]POH07155.1 hypothetical protein BGL35_07135 [Fructilactobacillus lindneri]POH24420.1 hypothetical protein BHU33_07170 [Fructilactobacillus lindneri DSM 20690 = JCM 11027]SKA07394.1 WxL domain surface cell wall-binding [Fructilactobacillus lindneri DSM 20690 = JCM